LEQIEEELPKRYLHIAHAFDVQVSGRRVSFSYWQRRLVELTRNRLVVDTKNPVKAAKDIPHWKDVDTLDKKIHYVLDVYFGFDVIRCSDKTAKNHATLLWHSRRSGRLIKHHKDGRGEVKLDSGGSTYSQGLTIIVDNFDGGLPLNPTKQNFAFGERSHGFTHHSNLMAMLEAATKAYYNFHFDASYKSKAILTSRVCSLKDKALDLVFDDLEAEAKIHSISDCDFTSFEDPAWTFHGSSLQLKRNKVQMDSGVDTLMSLPTTAAPETATPKTVNNVISPAAKSPKKKRQLEIPGSDDSEAEPLPMSVRQKAVHEGFKKRAKQSEKDAQERERVSQERARVAEERARVAEERARVAEERARVLQEDLLEARSSVEKFMELYQQNKLTAKNRASSSSKQETDGLKQKLVDTDRKLKFFKRRSERLEQENKDLLDMNESGGGGNESSNAEDL